MQTLVHCEVRNKQTQSPEAAAVHNTINTGIEAVGCYVRVVPLERHRAPRLTEC